MRKSPALTGLFRQTEAGEASLSRFLMLCTFRHRFMGYTGKRKFDIIFKTYLKPKSFEDFRQNPYLYLRRRNAIYATRQKGGTSMKELLRERYRYRCA